MKKAFIILFLFCGIAHADNLILQPNGGNVGIGTISPASTLEVAGSVSFPYVAKTAGYTLTASDYMVDCTSGSFTLDLPTAVGIKGRQYVMKNSGTGVITIDGNGTQTIDGDTTIELSQMYSSVKVISDNANWKIIGRN